MRAEGRGCSMSSIVATFKHCTSHMVERYQKMSMHPDAESKFRYACN